MAGVLVSHLGAAAHPIEILSALISARRNSHAPRHPHDRSEFYRLRFESSVMGNHSMLPPPEC